MGNQIKNDERYHGYDATGHSERPVLNVSLGEKSKRNLKSVHFCVLQIQKRRKIIVVTYDEVKNISNTHSNFIIDKDNTYGDYINGTINVEENGYFILSIPYDKGFNIKLDNKEIDYELVDTSFIGFEINKGNHTISINYTAPFSNIAKFISIIGVIIYIGIIIFDWRSKNEKN